MRKSHEERAKMYAVKINLLMNSGISHFTLDELSESLKKIGCNYPKDVCRMLNKKGIICKNDNKFIFASKEPVNYKYILEDIKKIYHIHNDWTKKLQPEEKIVNSLIDSKYDSSKDSSKKETAIQFLKSLGYKILKPTYVEI